MILFLVQYFDDTFPSLKEQHKFEEKLFSKTQKANGEIHTPPALTTLSHTSIAEIVMLDGVTAVYRSNVDLFFYVIGAQTENEVTLSNLSIVSLSRCCYSCCC